MQWKVPSCLSYTLLYVLDMPQYLVSTVCEFIKRMNGYHLFFCMYFGEENGNPLQYSCPENPMDGGVWCGHEELGTTEQLHFHFSLSCIGEGNGNPLQCFCLENPRDGEAWWAAVYGVAQSRTRLNRLSSSSTSIYI